jgi:hypothetical protein
MEGANKEDYLNNIQISREAIQVFDKVSKTFKKDAPDLSDIATELIHLEQENITKEYQSLVDHIRGDHE